MIVRTYALESLTHRTAGMIDARIESTPHDPADQSVALAALEEYAMEASIATRNWVRSRQIAFAKGRRAHG